MAKLLGIAIKPRPGDEMLLCSEALLDPQSGLVGDCCGKPGKRQVTLMNLSDWQTTCAELGTDLSWHLRRANLLVDHLPLYHSTGKRLQLGNALLEVTGETDPCERMEEAHAGLFQALLPEWRGGVTCKILQGGDIRLEMTVEILAS